MTDSIKLNDTYIKNIFITYSVVVTWEIRSMVKASLQDEIVKLLYETRYGLSVSKLAQKLGASRTTISKYLKILEDADKAFVQDIGQYKLWHQKENYVKNKARREALSTFMSLFTSLCSVIFPILFKILLI